jgi:hypothetical protein
LSFDAYTEFSEFTDRWWQALWYVQAVKSKDHGNRRKVVGVVRWLFAGTKHGLLLSKTLASIAWSFKVDHRVKLGWCVVVRELVEKEPLLYRSLPNSGEPLEL